jgi:hypothetical protein
VNERRPSWATDVALLWLSLVGISPLVPFDAGHTLATVPGVIDILVHVAATWALVCRWKIVRRTPAETVVDMDDAEGRSWRLTMSGANAEQVARIVRQMTGRRQ